MHSSFSELEYAAKKKVTRRERFLAEIETVILWTELEAVLEPFYPKGEGRGRPPIGLARMLRMYIVQQCFDLPDEGVEDAVYDSQAIRRFIGIDLNVDTAIHLHSYRCFTPAVIIMPKSYGFERGLAETIRIIRRPEQRRAVPVGPKGIGRAAREALPSLRAEYAGSSLTTLPSIKTGVQLLRCCRFALNR